MQNYFFFLVTSNYFSFLSPTLYLEMPKTTKASRACLYPPVNSLSIFALMQIWSFCWYKREKNIFLCPAVRWDENILKWNLRNFSCSSFKLKVFKYIFNLHASDKSHGKEDFLHAFRSLLAAKRKKKNLLECLFS